MDLLKNRAKDTSIRHLTMTPIRQPDRLPTPRSLDHEQVRRHLTFDFDAAPWAANATTWLVTKLFCKYLNAATTALRNSCVSVVKSNSFEFWPVGPLQMYFISAAPTTLTHSLLLPIYCAKVRVRGTPQHNFRWPNHCVLRNFVPLLTTFHINQLRPSFPRTLHKIVVCTVKVLPFP